MKTDIPHSPILRTKLHRPPVPDDHVPRIELLERLNKRCHQSVVLVSAPAGYGKSTLLSHWLEKCKRPDQPYLTGMLDGLAELHLPILSVENLDEK